ncbi:MAG: DVUA0089 family protein, partial [Sphaerospermopsis kisseleviana]
MKSSTTIPNNSSNFRFSWEISNSQYLVPNLDSILTQALQNTSQYLSQFRVDAEYTTKLKTTFGTNFHQEIANSIFDKLAQGDFSDITSIEIVSRNDINGANGAFSITTGKIYLAAEFIGQNANNVNAITAVLLEEVAHFVDAQINLTDTAGDEGEKFSALVRGVELSDAQTQQIQTEDDSAVITLNAQTIQIEQATVGANPAFDLIGLTRLRNDSRFAGIDGSGFTVAVLDTGLDASHTLISPNFRRFVDFVEGRTNAYDSGSHGTHVAGTVGARDENVGVAPDVGLIGLRAIGPLRAVRNSLQWVLDNRNQYNIIAVNMSLGVPETFFTNNSQIESQGGIITEINDIINRLENAGVTVVSAAGNDYAVKQIPGVSFPGISSTLNVGAVWQDNESLGRYVPGGSQSAQQLPGADRILVFSQRLDDPNNIYDTLFAPGAMIRSTVPGGGFERWPGTSMASPHVAGAVALMQEAAVQFGGRVLSPTEIVEILRSTGDQIFDGDDENDNVANTNTSYRRLNIYNAISEIKRRFEQIAPPPPKGGAGDPNGTITGAYLVQTALDGSSVDAILGSIGTDSGTTQVGDKDVDIFRFEVVVPGTVTIELGSHPNNANDFDTLLRLFNSSGTELVFDDDSGAGSFSRLEFDLNPGVYYAGVSGYNNRNYNPNVAGSGVAAATGNYSIQFSLGNTDLNGLLKNAVDISLGTDIDPF